MARLVTVADIIQRARILADMRSSNFITDAEALQLFNEAFTDLYDMMVESYQNWFSTTATQLLVPGTASYALPTDFYKMIAVELPNGGGYDLLFPFQETDRNSIVSIATSIPPVTVRYRYIPAPTIYTNPSQTIDGVAGWDGMIATQLAILMLGAEESNTGWLESRLARQTERIQSAAQNRDITMPGRVTDVTVSNSGAIRSTMQYRFYGNNIEYLVLEYLGI